MNTLKDTKIGETVRVKTLMGEGRIKPSFHDWTKPVTSTKNRGLYWGLF